MTSGWCILKKKHRKLKECWKHWIYPISTSTWEQLPKPLTDRSIAWIIGIPIMPFQSIEVKPGSMIYPLNPFGNLHTLALVNLSLKFHSRLFLQSQQTDSHVFSNARKRLPEGITINTTDQSSQKLGAASSLPSGHFTSKISITRGAAPQKNGPLVHPYSTDHLIFPNGIPIIFRWSLIFSDRIPSILVLSQNSSFFLIRQNSILSPWLPIVISNH